jgi:hypothetical protein
MDGPYIFCQRLSRTRLQSAGYTGKKRKFRSNRFLLGALFEDCAYQGDLVAARIAV